MQQETPNPKGKFIFTDSFRTKDILWEAYTGFIDNYHDYKMLKSMTRSDPITTAAMIKYAYYFYEEIEGFLESFKEDLKNTEEIKKIFEQEEFLDEDYSTIRKFFAKFMQISGIKNIVKEKDDPSSSVEMNRWKNEKRL